MRATPFNSDGFVWCAGEAGLMARLREESDMSMAVPGSDSGQSRRSLLARLIFWAPLVVPPFWAAFVLVAQPVTELGIPRAIPWPGPYAPRSPG